MLPTLSPQQFEHLHQVRKRQFQLAHGQTDLDKPKPSDREGHQLDDPGKHLFYESWEVYGRAARAASSYLRLRRAVRLFSSRRRPISSSAHCARRSRTRVSNPRLI
ncbi:hypothetical protein BC937DRAFT_88008, partial [Endogone sp. FLAS-F59071]